MGLFSKKSYCFGKEELGDKIPQKLLKIVKRIKGVDKSEADKILSVLCTPSKDLGSFFLLTSDTIIYVQNKGMIDVAHRYPLSSVTGISIQTKKLLSYLVINIGSSQVIDTDIYGEISDLNRFIGMVEQERQKGTAATLSAEHISSADEIMKFKELLDLGAISQEEFEAKKKQLLGL